MVAVLGGALVGASFWSKSYAGTNDTHPSPEVALAIITGAAVVIERTMEMIWTFVDMTFGTSWPLKNLNKRIQDRLNSYEDLAKPYFDKLTRAASNLGATDSAAVTAKVQSAIAALPGLKEQVAHLTGNERLNALTSKVSGKLSGIVADHPKLVEHLGADIDLAGDLADSSKAFLEDFKDNPVRRIIGIYAGAMAGILVATLAGVQIFGAASATVDPMTQKEIVVPHFGDWAIPFTGIVMGLGANPTHELISAIKQYKEKTKAENVKPPTA